MFNEDPRQSTRELSIILNVDQTTVLGRLHGLGKINKVGKWVPYKLSEISIIQRLNTCTSLLAKYKKKDVCGKLSLVMKNGYTTTIHLTKNNG